MRPHKHDQTPGVCDYIWGPDPGLDAQHMASGSKRYRGKESESGKCTAMEAEKVWKCTRKQTLGWCVRGHRCMRCVIVAVGVIGIVGELVPWDADDRL
jgi:hypothetical protein